MTKEDKKLLLKDLSTRLPYSVIVKYKSREKEGNVKITCSNIGYVTELGNGWWKECKPYLFPMSSMTKEQKLELATIKTYASLNKNKEYLLFDWLNAHHFDYRGLIEKGLAIEAPEGMYN